MKWFVDAWIFVICFRQQVSKVLFSFLIFMSSQTTSHKLRRREKVLKSHI